MKEGNGERVELRGQTNLHRFCFRGIGWSLVCLIVEPYLCIVSHSHDRYAPRDANSQRKVETGPRGGTIITHQVPNVFALARARVSRTLIYPNDLTFLIDPTDWNTL